MKKAIIHFTLIELLVVIAIIAILAAMLLPSLRSAQDKAKNTTCQTDMKQIGTGMLMYTDDFSGWFPLFNGYWPELPGNWASVILPYCGNNTAIWHCPKVVDSPTLPTYGANGELCGNLGRGLLPKRITAVLSPTGVMMLSEDIVRSWNGCGACNASDVNYIISQMWIVYGGMWYRHSNGANYVAIDGHVVWLPMNDVGGTAGPASGKIVWTTLAY